MVRAPGNSAIFDCFRISPFRGHDRVQQDKSTQSVSEIESPGAAHCDLYCDIVVIDKNRGNSSLEAEKEVVRAANEV